MNLQFHFQNISDVLKEDLKAYAQNRFDHLEKILIGVPEDNKLLRLNIDHQEKHNLYSVKSSLTVSGKTFHHEETTHNPKEAIDNTRSNFSLQMKKRSF